MLLSTRLKEEQTGEAIQREGYRKRGYPLVDSECDLNTLQDTVAYCIMNRYPIRFSNSLYLESFVPFCTALRLPRQRALQYTSDYSLQGQCTH